MIRKEKEENKKPIRLNFFFLFKPDQVPRCLDEGKALGRHVKLLSSRQSATSKLVLVLLAFSTATR